MFHFLKNRIQYKQRYGRWNKIDRAISAVISGHIRKSDHVLEMGSSTAHISFRLAQNGCRIDLLDILEDPIREAEKNFKSANLDAKFYVSDIFQHNIRYDLIWNAGLLQCYPPPNQEKLIQHLSGITEKLLLFCPNTDHSKAPNTGGGLRAVGDYKEYSVANIPVFLSKNFFLLEEGVLPAEETGYSFDFLWWFARHNAQEHSV